MVYLAIRIEHYLIKIFNSKKMSAKDRIDLINQN